MAGIRKGMNYHWPFDHLGCDPLATPLKKLPAVTPAQIRKSVESICQKLRDLGYHDVHATESGIEIEGAHSEAANSGAPVTAQMLQAMINHIDPDSPRDDWRNVAAALKSACVVTENGELDEQFDGLSLFDEWSAQGGKYEGYADCLKLWNSLKTRSEKKGSSIGLGTLIFLARRGGYDGPTRHSTPTKCWGQNLGPNDQTILERINARYAMIEAGPNASKIVDLDDPRRPQFMETTALSKIYANRPIFKLDLDGNKKPHNPVRVWMCSTGRRGISGIVHEPTGSQHPVPYGAHNTWQGPVVEPMCGDAHMPFVGHLLNHVCDEDSELFEYLLSWMADLVQRPGKKPGTAIALRGKQGAGKTIVFQYLQAILGPHALKVSQAEHLTGRFNGHLGGIVLLGAEEAFWAERRRRRGF